MTIVITMAGLGQRFRDAGYQRPKYMIEAKGISLFEWSMSSLTGYNSVASRYVFVVRKEDCARPFLKAKCQEMKIPQWDMVELEGMTDGQATTCMRAMPYCEKSEPILVYNIDTYIESNTLCAADIEGDGYIPCFHAPGTHWSFVKLDGEGKAIEVREKQRISDNCTLGAYFFSSAELYCQLYEEYYNNDKNLERNEKYIAPLYNLMIEKGMPVRISIVDADKVHVLGTPAELACFIDG